VNTVSVIVNYCSLEREFLPKVLAECAHFASEIVVSVGTHLYNGTEEDPEHIETLKEQYGGVQFVRYAVDAHIDLTAQQGVERRPHAYWPNVARWTGVQALHAAQWVLFLDADEIPDGRRMRAWLDQTPLDIACCYHLANYWYFKSPNNQALTWEQTTILIHRSRFTDEHIFSDRERDSLGFVPGIRNCEHVTGLDALPLIHHLSWVRSESVLLTKINTWSHRDQISDPVKYVKHIFSDSSINDIVHKYRYRYVYNKFHIYINTNDISYPLENPSQGYFKSLRNASQNSEHNNSNTSEVLFSAIDLYFDDKLNESVRLLQGIAQDATEPEVFNFLGFVLLSFGNYAAGADLFRKALTLAPHHARSSFHLGLAAYYTGEYFNAIHNFTEAITQDPECFEYYYYNACALLNVDSAGVALSGWKAAERLDSSFYGTQFNLGLASMRMGDTDKAKAYLQMTLHLNPLCTSAGDLLAQIP
jgi:tetratricopeptide (TPR) repeat protein